MVQKKTGPLTKQELMDLWRSVTDPSYHRPLLEKPDSGIEFIEQAAEQFAAVSQAIDANTQAMYILPWSGQTAEPASGEQYATVALQIARGARVEQPLTFLAGAVVFQHTLNDYGPDGPVVATTGRRYIVAQTATLAPGDMGPLEVACIAEKPGAGYNNPAPDTITTLLQSGTGLTNDGGSVLPGSQSTHEMRSSELPDTPTLSNVGAYMLFTAGANAGQSRRIVGYANPIPGVSGGSVLLAADGVFSVSTSSGTFDEYEQVQQDVSGAIGRLLVLSTGHAVVQRTSGTFIPGVTVTGLVSGATFVVDAVEQSPDMVAETGTAVWRILSYADDFKLQITNAESPSGGRCAFLDELGLEREMPRQLGEDDSMYRNRISKPADVVSPNALRRAGNRVLKPFGLEVCLREVGRPQLPGFFLDASPTYAPNAYDLEALQVTFNSPPSDPAYPHFIDGEIVKQDNGGVITTGQVQVNANGIVTGIVRVDGPGFVMGELIRGEQSEFADTLASIPTGGLLPHLRFVMLFDDVHYRGFFMIGIPSIPTKARGLAYDGALNNAFDAVGINNFLDSTGTNASDPLYQQVYAAVDKARAAGVNFILYREDIGCF